MAEMLTTTTGTTMNVMKIQPSVALVSISQDGNVVCIDWSEVEKQAKGSDRFLMPLSKALLAARNGTWQSIAPH